MSSDSKIAEPYLLDKINTEFESSFSMAARVAKEMGCINEALLAAKRVFSYNPNSLAILDLFPQFKPLITEISNIIDSKGESLKKDAGNQQYWTVLGSSYLALGDFPNAFAAFAHALRVSAESSHPSFWYAMGIVYSHYRYYEHGMSCLQKVLSLKPDFEFCDDVIFRLGLISRQLPDSMNGCKAALNFFDQSRNRPPKGLTPEDVELQIAYTYQMMDQQDRALQLYTELHHRFPKALKVTQQYCWMLFLQSNSPQSLENVKAVVTREMQDNPLDPTLLLMAARIAMRQDDMTTAYQHYRFCISYCSDSPYFWCGLGVLYFRNDQIQDAVIAFQRALFLKSELKEAWLNIGLIFERQNDYTSAIRIYHTGSQKCNGATEFSERLSALNMQRSGHRKFNAPYSLIDVDDSKFIIPIPEQFATEYISAVPELPADCFDIGEQAEEFKILATFPTSYFT